MPFPGIIPILGALGALSGKQVAPAAPPFQPGQMPQGGLLGGSQTLGGPSVTDGFMQKIGGIPDISDLVQSAPASDVTAPPVDMPETEGFGEKIGGFMGGMDKTLQSPTKRLGLGLLDQQDPRLALGALLASGLFGGKGG